MLITKYHKITPLPNQRGNYQLPEDYNTQLHNTLLKYLQFPYETNTKVNDGVIRLEGMHDATLMAMALCLPRNWKLRTPTRRIKYKHAERILIIKTVDAKTCIEVNTQAIMRHLGAMQRNHAWASMRIPSTPTQVKEYLQKIEVEQTLGLHKTLQEQLQWQNMEIIDSHLEDVRCYWENELYWKECQQNDNCMLRYKVLSTLTSWNFKDKQNYQEQWQRDWEILRENNIILPENLAELIATFMPNPR